MFVEFYLKYALGIISEYLEDDFVQTLEKKFNFKPILIETIGKRKSSAGDCNDSKKLKYESSNVENIVNGILPDIEQSMTEVKKQQKPLTAKEKARQKAASGTKTISAFFTKKWLFQAWFKIVEIWIVY